MRCSSCAGYAGWPNWPTWWVWCFISGDGDRLRLAGQLLAEGGVEAVKDYVREALDLGNNALVDGLVEFTLSCVSWEAIRRALLENC